MPCACSAFSIGDGGFAGGGQPGKPQHAWLLVLDRRPRSLVDGMAMAMDVGGPPQSERDHAGAGGRMGEAVDQDEGAGAPVLRIGVESHRARGREVAEADFVQRQRPARPVLQRVDVDLVLERRDLCRQRPGADPQEIGAPRQQRLLVHPQHMRAELVGDLWPLPRRHQHIAAADVDVLRQRQRDRVAGRGTIAVTIKGDNAFDAAGLARGRDHDFVADRDLTRGQRARIAAEIEIGTVHPLHRKAQRQLVRGLRDIDGLEMLEQRRATIP
jgi:hypothetical protein